MANPLKKNEGNKEDTDGSAPDESEQNKRDEYEVGYRKPPASTRFKKGQSGNPFGRPRKPKMPQYQLRDAPRDKFLGEEAYRPIGTHEGGKRIELPLAQALLRSLEVSALRGNRLSAQYLLKRIDEGEERHLQQRIDNYIDLGERKRRGEALIAEHKRRNLPPPDLIPHPDDIVIRPCTVEAYVDGPETREEAQAWEWLAAERDFYLLRSAHARNIGATFKINFEGKKCCFYIFAAYKLNRGLPRRLQWPNDDKPYSLLLKYTNLSRHEGERLIAEEQAKQDATSPVQRMLPPEMLQEAKRIAEKIMKMGQRSQPYGASSKPRKLKKD